MPTKNEALCKRPVARAKRHTAEPGQELTDKQDAIGKETPVVRPSNKLDVLGWTRVPSTSAPVQGSGETAEASITAPSRETRANLTPERCHKALLVV